MNKTKVTFKKWDCVVEYAHYKDLAPAILLKDAEDGSPIATATVFLAEEHYDKSSWDELKEHGIYPSNQLPQRKCYIKTWSENEGMDEALREAGVIGPQEKAIDINGFGSLAVLTEIIDPNFKIE